MRRQPECYDCALNQGFRTFQLARQQLGLEGEPTAEETAQLERDLRAALDAAHADLTPAALSRIPLKVAAEMAGCDDPYLELKQSTNQHALEHLDEVRALLEESDDPLHTGALLAVAGNIIDLGIHREYDLRGTLRRILEQGFAVDCFASFRDRLYEVNRRGGMLFYIGDNSGEIVFDRLFIEVIQRTAPRVRVVFAVKGGAILNDALLEDARVAGIDRICEVVTTGNDYIGTELDKCSEEFMQVYRAADIIVAKGQGNFETLEDKPGPIYMILQAKCPIIAKELDVELWEAAFLRR